jgi:hypothetical protein
MIGYLEIIIYSVSLTILLTTSAILERPKIYIIGILPTSSFAEKNISILLFCSQCLGFWVGLFFSIIYNDIGIVRMLMLPVISSTVSGILSGIMDIQNKEEEIGEKDE